MSQTAEDQKLTPAQASLLEQKYFAVVTTLMADGSPQSTVVWVDTDGENALFNTARGRLKTRNLERDPRISLAIVDHSEPYAKLIVIRGRAELIDDGADANIDKLAKKYIGQDVYPWRQPNEQRVIVKIHAEKITGPME
ncbi:MAG TPA: PPOX class F420-dependent oxidoreductase [Candidatus Dormibacteraeota bacterium]|jgi:PPOX class probable F420-dependent enzyme|nr:PPOX class F420-dependent oxidoreductase [Candidatus Dormibacteraeota bacterium]